MSGRIPLAEAICECLRRRRSVSIADIDAAVMPPLGIRDRFVVLHVIWKLIDEDIIDFTPFRDIKRGKRWRHRPRRTEA